MHVRNKVTHAHAHTHTRTHTRTRTHNTSHNTADSLEHDRKHSASVCHWVHARLCNLILIVESNLLVNVNVALQLWMLDAPVHRKAERGRGRGAHRSSRHHHVESVA